MRYPIVLAAVIGLALCAPAEASPLTGLSEARSTVATTGDIQAVHYRRHHRHYGYYGGGYPLYSPYGYYGGYGGYSPGFSSFIGGGHHRHHRW